MRRARFALSWGGALCGVMGFGGGGGLVLWGLVCSGVVVVFVLGVVLGLGSVGERGGALPPRFLSGFAGGGALWWLGAFGLWLLRCSRGCRGCACACVVFGVSAGESALAEGGVR